ncbi:cytochrome c biogenesis CcdA family protein [Paractinoplanes hotanensis]|uniref:Cytochrome c biogenesis protein CcdA n=1 Tax=Paractinoplanes hotanensis TaxID=2906497 RepID=A0ABT0Y566_9ACTN|nr:cytochrome c biogenesis protein CcdA [Actinoplanes hotanensis]MCM4081181.1 cytochrome c biogenesis protein CcdA [Actinoplanes hotanensis]
MTEAPFALAVAAGTLAALNPCGFALLPVYLTVLITDGDQASRARAVARAMISTAAIVTGFVAVFALFGLALAPVAGLVQARLPWFTIVLGLALAGLGVWLLCGRSLPGISLLAGRGPVAVRTIPSMAAFGAGYALTSLSCTIGPFLAIVVSSFRAGSPFTGVLLFLAYAAGMGMVVGIAALALALARTSVIGRMRRLAPLISRAGGVVIALAGAYVAYYGWYELRVLRGATADDPVISAALTVQGWFSNAVADLGVPVVAFTFATVLASAGAAVWWSWSRRRAVKQLR